MPDTRRLTSREAGYENASESWDVGGCRRADAGSGKCRMGPGNWHGHRNRHWNRHWKRRRTRELERPVGSAGAVRIGGTGHIAESGYGSEPGKDAQHRAAEAASGGHTEAAGA